MSQHDCEDGKESPHSRRLLLSDVAVHLLIFLGALPITSLPFLFIVLLFLIVSLRFAELRPCNVIETIVTERLHQLAHGRFRHTAGLVVFVVFVLGIVFGVFHILIAPILLIELLVIFLGFRFHDGDRRLAFGALARGLGGY